MHLFAHELVPRRPTQIGLFDGPRGRAEALARLKREVNARHGRFALRSAATLPLVGDLPRPVERVGHLRRAGEDVLLTAGRAYAPWFRR